MTDIVALDNRWARPGRAAVTLSPLGGPVIALAAPGGRATVALQGAQVLSWVPTGWAEALWHSPVARLGTAKAVRGGIPVCWPWFGPHPTDAARPAHGFARTAKRTVSAAEVSERASRVVLALDARDTGAAAHGTDAHVTLAVTLDEGLDLELTSTARGGAPLMLTQALHTYFAVDEIARVSVTGLEGQDYIDSLDGGREKPQRGRIIFDRETDRIYLGPAPEIVIDDQGAGRRVVVRPRGSRSTVVWNPWIDKARRLGDMGESGWRRMVCVETANAGPDRIELQPGGTHVLGANLAMQGAG